jgi:hypothetical protein
VFNAGSERAWIRFQKQVKELGGVLVEPEWLGAKAGHRIVCANGHPRRITPTHLRKRLCSKCPRPEQQTGYAGFLARVTELGGVVLDSEWKGANKPHEIRCPKGHEVPVFPSVLRGGGGLCSACSGRSSRYSWLKFKARISELGGTVVEPEWLGSSKQHRAICAKSHPVSICPRDVMSGQGMCLTCAGKNPETAWADFKERVEAEGGRVIEPRWLGGRIPHAIICRNRHVTDVRPDNSKTGQGICRECKGKAADRFYVVTSADGLKFGITSGNPKPRLKNHASDGYTTVVRLLITTDALDLERATTKALARSGWKPIRGREYFDISCLHLVLEVADGWKLKK